MVLLLALLSVGSMLSGGLFAWLANERRNARERALLAREMTRQVKLRYAAYLALEKRVTGVIAEFDRLEDEFVQQLDEQRSTIGILTQALDDHEGVVTEVAPAEAARWMESWSTKRQQQDAQDRQAIESEVAQWQDRLRTVQEEKRAELERQKQEIQALTDRVRNLEPLTAVVDQKDGEAQEWRDRCDQLERELGELQGELASARELEGARADLESQVLDYHQMVEQIQTSLDGAQQRATGLEEEAEELRRQVAEATDQRAKLEARAAEADEALGAAMVECAYLADELTTARAQFEAQGIELECKAELEALRAEAQAATKDLTSRERELAALQEQLAHQDGRVSELEAEIQALREQTSLRESRIGELMADLDSTQSDLATKARNLAAKDSSVEAAQHLLGNLKPLLDALESQLDEGAQKRV